MTSFKLGIMTYFAVKRWPEPEAWTEIIGVDFELNLVQFCFDLLDPRSNKDTLIEVTDRILDSLNRYGLSIPCCINGFIGYCQNLLLHPIKSMRMDALDWWEKAVRLTSDLGAKTCGGFLGAMSSNDIIKKKRRNFLETSIIEDINHLTDIGASLNQESFILEAMPLAGEFPTTMSETKHLLKKVNKTSKIPVKLLFDIGHPYGPGVLKDEKDACRWLEQFTPITYCVHLQQTDKNGDCHWPFTDKYNKIGVISGEEIIESIEKSGTKECFLILEIVHPTVAPGTQVIEDHKISIKYWRDILGL